MSYLITRLIALAHTQLKENNNMRRVYIEQWLRQFENYE